MPTQLTAPTITATLASNGTDIQISGISSANASGYKVRWGTLSGYGREDAITPTDGSYTLSDTFARTTYFVAVQAVGDGVEYTDSGWSNEVCVVTEGEVDEDLTPTTPSISSTLYYTAICFNSSSFTAGEQYRCQIATSEAGLATAPTHALMRPSYSQLMMIGGLQPDTTYYVRTCRVYGRRCGAWSSVVTATTRTPTDTVYVTDGGDSGAGTLREVITNASAGTKIVLNVSSISLTSTLSISADVLIESGLSTPTTITTTQVLVLSGSVYLHNVIIDGTSSTGLSLTGKFDGCVIRGGTKTSQNSSIVSSTQLYGCRIEDCTGYNRLIYTAAVIESVIVGCKTTNTVNTTQDNGVVSHSDLVNSVVSNCTTPGYGVVRTTSGINVLIQDCSVSGSYSGGVYGGSWWGSTIQNCTANNYGGGVYGSGLWCSRVIGCTSSSGGAFNPALVDCIVDGCGKTNSGVQNGTATNTIICNCVSSRNGGGAYTVTLSNCIVDNCSAGSSMGDGGGCYGGTAIGTTIRNCSAPAGYGGGARGTTLSNCTIEDCYSLYSGGAIYIGTATNTRIINCGSNQSNGGACVDATLTDCTIEGCYSNTGSSGGAFNCTLIRCKVLNCKSKIEGSVSNCDATDCLIVGAVYKYNVSTGYDVMPARSGSQKGHYKNCTIGKIDLSSAYAAPASSYLYNCLYKSWTTAPTGGNANNLCYDGLESTYFNDASNGDYTLKRNSPAINAGDDQYVATGDLDLAGNARINGTAVDIGAYEFYSSQLDPPTFTVTPGAGGTGSVAFELPEGGVSFLVESAAESTFQTPTQYTGTTSPLAISGNSGTVFFRARTIGTTSDENSDWSAASTAFFDADPPVVTPTINPWKITKGATENVFSRFTVSDIDPNPVKHYYLLDGQGNEITIGGVTEDIPTATIPSGSYTLQLRATDNVGNVGTGNLTLDVMIDTPVVAVTTGADGTATMTFTTPQGASSITIAYQPTGDYSPDHTTYIYGAVSPVTATGLDGNWTFWVQAVSPTGTYDSTWGSATATLDAYPPVLTIPETAVDLTCGATVDLMTGVSATDNQDPAPTISYTLQDSNGNTVTIGGVSQDLATNLLSPGTYTIVYSASDATGNVATAERALKVRLAAPTYTITTGANGTATISYTLPEGATGCDILPLFSESFNPPVWIMDAPNPCIVSGLNGPYVFYLHATSPNGQYDSKNVKSGVYWLDNNTPVVTVEDRSPIEYVVGDDTVNLLDGVTATDDHDATVPLVYYLTDASDEIVEVDGVRQNIPSEDVPTGGYKIVYEATDSAGNKGYADKGLLVLPTVLTTPQIACIGLYNTTATISGLDVENAYGYLLDVDGTEQRIDVPSTGTYAIQNLQDNATHTIKVKALGDWVFPEPPEAPSGHYRDSEWSNTITVTIGSPAADNAPVVAKKAVTDRAITLSVSNYESSAGYFEIILSESETFQKPLRLTMSPADEITIGGLKSSTIYWIKLRAVFASSVTPYSTPVLAQTTELTATTLSDKLLYVRERIRMLRGYLADIANIDTISIDGISESRVDRAALLRELAELEAEEARLQMGGGRMYTIDARWVIR